MALLLLNLPITPFISIMSYYFFNVELFCLHSGDMATTGAFDRRKEGRFHLSPSLSLTSKGYVVAFDWASIFFIRWMNHSN